jgi:hypothetical protein
MRTQPAPFDDHSPGIDVSANKPARVALRIGPPLHEVREALPPTVFFCVHFCVHPRNVSLADCVRCWPAATRWPWF